VPGDVGALPMLDAALDRDQAPVRPTIDLHRDLERRPGEVEAPHPIAEPILGFPRRDPLAFEDVDERDLALARLPSIREEGR